MSNGAFRVFTAFKNMWSGDAWENVKIKGSGVWKLDKYGGWMLEDGKGGSSRSNPIGEVVD